MLHGLFLAALLLVSTAAVHPKENTETEQTNGDGSQLRITQTPCDANNDRTIRLELRVLPWDSYRTVLDRRQSCSDHPRGGGQLQDIDGDGLLEYVELESCGAGPNCARQIFKIDAQKLRADRFFKGSFSSFHRIDDLYVSSGRASCCSWEHLIYNSPGPEHAISDRNLMYRITVKAPLSDHGSVAQCLISRPLMDAWEQTTLDHPNLIQLCETYGDKYVLNPGQ